ncbi:MAG: AAA family ATPase [Paludibacteraceae bacterium]|nr:AAA family ATPase [Paludibacteraceae bacterium]
MAVKLIKACKDLNISMKTLLDFCSMMGYPVAADPNARIDDDVYLLLQKEFGQNGRADHRGLQSIGAKNFRKFEELKPIALNGITYVVGGNNAGKSTIVKALRLVVENLTNLASIGNGYSIQSMTPTFHFDLKGLNIGTFEKAHNRNAVDKSITFESELSENMHAVIKVEQQSNNSPVAVVSFLRLEDNSVQCAFEVDVIKGKMRLYNTSGFSNTEDAEDRLHELKITLKLLSHELDDIQSQLADPHLVLPMKQRMELLNKAGTYNAEKERLMSYIKNVEADIKTTKEAVQTHTGALLFEMNMSLNNDNPDDNLLVRLMKGMKIQLSTQNSKAQSQKSKNPVYAQVIDGMIGNLRWALASSKIEYIGAHAATQKTIFSLDDRNDETVAIIHEWYQQQILPGEAEHRFILDWMRELEIGVDFKIENHYGEAYSVSIKEHENELASSMSELGMGAIQMMTLLLHLSSIMRKYNGNRNKPLIIFEEPEQNMHPDWQSHLADIFEEVRSKGFRIMVETHSEYMIRKSQVQVAKMPFADQADLDDNCPIATYYFPTDGEPYKMEYRTDGKFMNGFGNGFYDEAANLAFDIM